MIAKHSLHIAAIILCLLFSGCSSNKPITIKDFGKSTTNHITNLHIEQLHKHIKTLTKKLYKRNPRELAKNPGHTVSTRIEQLFNAEKQFQFTETNHLTGTDAINLAFSRGYDGDRVFALILGIRSMLYTAYNLQDEMFYFDTLDPQLLYNSARNLERVNWLLNNKKNNQNTLLLLSNGYQEQVANLSYERVFGKMISLQDMMAAIIADRTNRNIVTLIQGVASTALIPIGT